MRVSLDYKRTRLVLPLDVVEVEKSGKLPLALMSEFGQVSGGSYRI